MMYGMRMSLKFNKAYSWLEKVPYTLEDFRKRIESTFPSGMTWEDFKSDIAHNDHFLPRAIFVYEKPTDTEFQICWSLNNLRAMWGEENQAKSDTLPDGQRGRDKKYDYEYKARIINDYIGQTIS